VNEEIRMSYVQLVLACTLVAVVASIHPTNSFAQEGTWIVPTSGGSLDIMLEQNWTDNGTARFKITFLNPNTTQIHEHQDYDVLIRQGDNQIFSAAGEINQPLIHNVEGTVTVPVQPFSFPQNGDYIVEVQVLGLGFPPIPINPETATFPITVVPEFPAGVIAAVAAVMAGSIALTRKFRLF
jgi:hypothetical protein